MLKLESVLSNRICYTSKSHIQTEIVFYLIFREIIVFWYFILKSLHKI